MPRYNTPILLVLDANDTHNRAKRTDHGTASRQGFGTVSIYMAGDEGHQNGSEARICMHLGTYGDRDYVVGQNVWLLKKVGPGVDSKDK